MRSRNLRQYIPVVVVLLASFVGTKPSFAQSDGYVTNSNLRGDMSFGTYFKGDIDNINLATGTVNLKIPLINRKGRGIDTGEDVFYSSKLWIIVPVFDTNGNIAQMDWEPSSDLSAVLHEEGTGEGGILEWTEDKYTCNFKVGTQTHQSFVTIQSNFDLAGPDGEKFQFPNEVVTETINVGLSQCIQPFPGSQNPPAPPPNAMPIPTGFSDSGTVKLDTSGSTFVVSFKDGRQEFVSSTESSPLELIDTNGNFLGGSSNTDTVGRTTLADSSGNAVNFTLGSAAFVTPTTQFPTTGSNGCILQDKRPVPEVPSLQLPNGQSYTFTYDPNFGEITKVTLPTGGYIKYVYTTYPQLDQNPFGVVSNGNGNNNCYKGLLDSRRVTERHVSADGVTEAVWHYSYTTTTTTVTDPLGNVTVHTFSSLSGVSPVYETEQDVNDNAGHLLEKVTNNWGTDSGPTQTNQDGSYTWTIKNPRITSVTTTLSDTNQVKQVSTTYDKSNTYDTLTNLGNTTESRMNVMETDEYDWGSGAAGPLLRKTVYDYLHYDNSTYLNAHIWDRVSSKTIYDNASNTCLGMSQPCAKSTYKYDSTAITATSGVVAHDYTGHSSTFTTRGNLTETDAWRNTDGATLVSLSYYDDLGNLVQTKDPNGNLTSYSYADSWFGTVGATCAPPSGSTTQAYKTQVTDALGHVNKYSYYSCSSLAGSVTDPNNQVASSTYDHLDRVASETRPDTGQTTFTYTDPASPTSSNPVTAELQTPIGNGATLEKTALIDGLGRVNSFELNSDPSGADFLGFTYDNLGRISCTTNPYRTTSDPTYGTTCTTYDALGRPIKVTKPDGSVVTTSYSGNCTTVTDEAGKNRESCADGLGRMTSVIEDTGTGHLNYTTNYTYDALGNLLSVVQGGSRQRTFTYDSLSRLLTAANPESGTVTYTYDNDGNVLTKKDARGITATNSYNGINQLKSVTYSNGDPTVSYTYDETACLGQSACYNVGHRTTMTDAAGAEHLSYDKMGREITEQRTTNSITKSTSYTYNLLGEMATLTYPSGRVITYTYDSAGRPSDAQDVANSINYVVGPCANGSSGTGVCYAPSGALSQMQNGTNFVSTYIYDQRFEPCWMYATTGTPLPVSTACTATDPGPGNILDLKYSFNLGAGDNGNVMGITNNRDTTRSQSFTYDALNRIATAKTSSTTGSNCWGQTYTIDQWANLTNINPVSGYTGCSQGSLNVSATANNQLSATGYSYDLSGNMLTDAANTYTYNGESEIVTAAGVTYTYDGDGNRVERSNGRIFWYGAGSEILDETDLSGNLQLEMVYFGGKRVAHRVPSSGNIYYYAEDMLGSARGMVQAGQTTLCYDADFTPFGGERSITNTCSQNYKFEGKRRDPDTGNDDFGARYYSSRIGRWLSADWSSVPVPVPYANLGNPQTLNLYAMVSDNPETFADLDGHDAYYGAEGSSNQGEAEQCEAHNCPMATEVSATTPAQDRENARQRDDSTVDGTQTQTQKITYSDQALKSMFDKIASQSPTFASELTAIASDSKIASVKVQEPGAAALPDHAPADTIVKPNSDGKLEITITVRSGDEGHAEHEMGHVHDVRTNRDQFFSDAKRDAHNKGGPFEQAHDDRPIEQRADRFKTTVEQERKEFRKEQQQ